MLGLVLVILQIAALNLGAVLQGAAPLNVHDDGSLVISSEQLRAMSAAPSKDGAADVSAHFFHNTSTGICTRMLVSPETHPISIRLDEHQLLWSTRQLLPGGSPIAIEHTRKPTPTCAPGMDWPAERDEVVFMGAFTEARHVSSTEQVLVFVDGQKSDGCTEHRRSIVHLKLDGREGGDRAAEFKWLSAESPECSTEFELRVPVPPLTEFGSTSEDTAEDYEDYDEDEDERGYVSENDFPFNEYEEEVASVDEDDQGGETTTGWLVRTIKEVKEVYYRHGVVVESVFGSSAFEVSAVGTRAASAQKVQGPSMAGLFDDAQKVLLVAAAASLAAAWIFASSCRKARSPQPAQPIGDKLMV